MTFDQALPYILVAIAALLLIAAFVFLASRKTTVVQQDKRDVLDEGASPAQRNQALIDAPTAAKVEPVTPEPIITPTPPVEPVAEPAPAPQPAPPPAPPASAPTNSTATDDLTQIKGVGPKLVAILAEQGVTSFGQIAAWSDSDVARIDETLGRFKGRITRDQWVEQAKLLAGGENSAFSEKFGQNR